MPKRTIPLAIALVAGSLLTLAALVDWDEPRPPLGPDIEPVCADAMQRSAPDLSWIAPGREHEAAAANEFRNVPLGLLSSAEGSLVRVTGLLHVEFEWVALYPSRAALVQFRPAPWVELGPLWPGEPYWATKGPSVSDRCAVLIGRYSGGDGRQVGLFNGRIRSVLRLDVWSTPHRPFVTLPPKPPPVHRTP